VRVEAEQSGARQDAARALATSSGAEFVSVIGKIAILYRAHPEQPTIKLPE